MPATVLDSSPLRLTCVACGGEIQPYETHRRETVQPVPVPRPPLRVWHLTCSVETTPPPPGPPPF